MRSPIHEYLPPEIFSEILLAAIHTPFKQSHNGWDSPVRSAVHLSSVCRAWRELVVSLPSLWSDLHFSNFTHPSQSEAQGCIDNVLKRSRGRFKHIALNFTSLSGSANGDDVIARVLDTVLAASLTSDLAPSWNELSVMVAEYDQMCAVSDHLLFSTSDAARVKLGQLTILRLIMTTPSPSLDSPSALTQSLTLPRFDTRHFKSLTRIYLTHTHILVFPATLPSSQLQVCLKDWTDIIEDTFLTTASLDPDVPPSPLYYQLGINDSQLNTYPFTVEISGVSRLGIAFPVTIPSSARHIGPSTSSSLPPLTPYTNIAPFLTHTHFPHLTCLQLTHVTPSIWSAFLDLVRQPRTPNVEPNVKFEQLKDLILLFVRNIRPPPVHPKFLKSGPGVGRGPDYDYDLGRAKDEWDQRAMMNKCLKFIDKEAMPSLENLLCGTTDGAMLWRAKVNLKPRDV